MRWDEYFRKRSVLEKVKKQDEDYGFEEKFNYILE